MSEPLIDADALARLRSERGLSQRALGAEAGLNPVVISTLERGRNHADLTLRQLQRIAGALGVAPSSLLAKEGWSGDPVEAKPEDAIVEAALVCTDAATTTTDLATALNWPLKRVTQALQALERRLGVTGQRLHRASNGYSLRAAEILTEEERVALNRVRLRTGGLRVSTMRLLYRAIESPLDGDWERYAGNAARVERGILQNAGLLEPGTDGLEPSTDVKKSLRLI
jgi:transcriptional regulator with XRE-family HTH domain